MFWNQVRLQGSTMGNDQEFIDMLKLTSEQQLVPMIDSVRPFEEVTEALDRMRDGQQFGKIVLSIT
jgi:D-arabinose 1-dehydrogenase-like Zn-dependent alcohol dehydrogenase